MLSVAIIDDEESVYHIISKIIEMEKLPMSVDAYIYDGRHALKLLEDANFDLIFVDIRMPYHSGLEVMETYPEFQYIVITAYNEFEYAQEALRLNAKDILLKPIDRKKFVAAVNRVFNMNLYGNEIVDDLILYLNKNYYQVDLNLTDLANRYFMKASNLCRLFKNHTNQTIMNYLTSQRINRAKDLLQESNMSISEISHSVGFQSETVFYRKFKELNHITPSTYRKSL
ncbi:response regulator transcription factor [Facklamia sp. P12934]|uniref:response regulator transcription factor n=1 Tax=unclassified Facklamia TaxID=2622293 RepID=UPI003D17E438